MKRLLAAAVSLVCVVSIGAYAQLTFSIAIRTPTPAELSVWQRDPTIVTVSVANTGQIALSNLRISFVIRNTDNGRTVAAFTRDNESGNAALQHRSICHAGAHRCGGRERGGGGDRLGHQDYSSDHQPSAGGTFEFCARVIDASGNALGAAGEIYQTFLVLIPNPPSLQQPEDGTALAATGLPVFQWTSVPAPPGTPLVLYRLKISPIYSGQLSRDAIERNTPLFNRTMSATTYTYLPSDLQFSDTAGSNGVRMAGGGDHQHRGAGGTERREERDLHDHAGR